MIPNLKLINAFRKTADYLEQAPTEFNHNNYSKCLIGTLVYVNHPSYKRDDITNIMYENGLCLYSEISPSCETTGIPLNEIYAYLITLGINTKKDLEEIEFPLGEGIIPTVEQAINYFRIKADKLEIEWLSNNNPLKLTNNIISQSVIF